MRNKTFVKKLIKNVNQTLTLVKRKNLILLMNLHEQSERYLWYKHAKKTEQKWGTPW